MKVKTDVKAGGLFSDDLGLRSLGDMGKSSFWW